MRTIKCWTVALGLACAAFVPQLSLAQDYPARPVKLVVPFPPGGTTDVVARILAAKLSSDLGQQFVIDNKGGAGGTLGAGIVSKSPADGYNLLLFHIGMVYGTALYKSLPYDVERDFTPISLTGSAPSALIVTPSLPAKTLAEFVALAKAKPGTLNYGTAGAGSSGHLAVELFQVLSQTKVTHVPYRGGGPAVTATISGEVQFMIETAGSIVSHVQAGTLRALAVTGEQRASTMPDVPTMKEAGISDYIYTTWYGVWAPAATPAPIVTKLNQAIRSAFADSEVKSALDKAGIDPVTSTADQFAALIRSDHAKWTKIIRDAAIPPQ